MAGKKTQLRVLLNFYVPAERSMKVIAGGTAWFQSVYGTDGLFSSMTSHGKAGDQQKRHTVEPHQAMTDEERITVAGCLPHELARVARGQAGGWDSGRLAA
jgi:hypothetical protein